MPPLTCAASCSTSSLSSRLRARDRVGARVRIRVDARSNSRLPPSPASLPVWPPGGSSHELSASGRVCASSTASNSRVAEVTSERARVSNGVPPRNWRGMSSEGSMMTFKDYCLAVNRPIKHIPSSSSIISVHASPVPPLC